MILFICLGGDRGFAFCFTFVRVGYCAGVFGLVQNGKYYFFFVFRGVPLFLVIFYIFCRCGQKMEDLSVQGDSVRDFLGEMW